MTYEELKQTVDGAWALFFDHLGFYGLDTDAVSEAMDGKDCFNDVFDAIISNVELENKDD